jgi:hypothetical protein
MYSSQILLAEGMQYCEKPLNTVICNKKKQKTILEFKNLWSLSLQQNIKCIFSLFIIQIYNIFYISLHFLSYLISALNQKCGICNINSEVLKKK